MSNEDGWRKGAFGRLRLAEGELGRAFLPETGSVCDIDRFAEPHIGRRDVREPFGGKRSRMQRSIICFRL
jgi:hypothetical protein